MTAVPSTTHAKAGVVAGHLSGKQLTHGVQNAPHDSLFRRHVEISNKDDSSSGGSGRTKGEAKRKENIIRKKEEQGEGKQINLGV